MKKFRYPLERLKQVRDLELSSAADTLREIVTEMQKVKSEIENKQGAIHAAQKLLVDSEAKSGTVRPDLRSLSALYIHAVQTEREQLDKIFMELQEKQLQAHALLLEKKQSVKMLENHEKRLSSHHQLHLQKVQQKEDDELWLTRRQN